MSDRSDRTFRYVLCRCSELNDAEVRLLGFVASYSLGCLLSYGDICKKINWSRGKLTRTIEALKRLGLIEITHRCYKRATIKIATAAFQSAFAKQHDISLVRHQSCLTSEIVMSHPRTHDVSPARHSILEYELERKLESDLINQKVKSVDNSRAPIDAVKRMQALLKVKTI